MLLLQLVLFFRLFYFHFLNSCKFHIAMARKKTVQRPKTQKQMVPAFSTLPLEAQSRIAGFVSIYSRD